MKMTIKMNADERTATIKAMNQIDSIYDGELKMGTEEVDYGANPVDKSKSFTWCKISTKEDRFESVGEIEITDEFYMDTLVLTVKVMRLLKPVYTMAKAMSQMIKDISSNIQELCGELVVKYDLRPAKKEETKEEEK